MKTNILSNGDCVIVGRRLHTESKKVWDSPKASDNSSQMMQPVKTNSTPALNGKKSAEEDVFSRVVSICELGSVEYGGTTYMTPEMISIEAK